MPCGVWKDPGNRSKVNLPVLCAQTEASKANSDIISRQGTVNLYPNNILETQISQTLHSWAIMFNHSVH